MLAELEGEVLLLGGDEGVAAALADRIGRAPRRVGAEAVVAGAARRAGDRDVLLLEASAHTLALETAGGCATPLIPRHRTLPTVHVRTFTSYTDNSPVNVIGVYEGEAQFTRENRLVGRFALHGVPPLPRGVPRLEVCFLDCYQRPEGGCVFRTHVLKYQRNTSENHSGSLTA